MFFIVCRSCSNVQQNNKLWLKVSAEALKKPKVRVQFFTVHVLKTCKNVQLYVILIIILTPHSVPFLLSTLLFHFLSVSLISVLWLPFVLIQNTDKFFNIWWKIVILRDKILLLFSFEIVDRVQNGMEPKLKFTKLFSIVHVQKLSEFNYWELTFGIGSSVSVINQF